MADISLLSLGDTDGLGSTFGEQLTTVNILIALANAQLIADILNTLTTTEKGTLVGAINEVDAKRIPVRLQSGELIGVPLQEEAEINMTGA